jgi:uncharacterized glyoxalase superfamily protein PhnB
LICAILPFVIVKPAERSPWGGVSGYFSDPGGYLWKVASGEGAPAVAA